MNPTPLRFRRGLRELYALLTMPSTAKPPSHGVVFCNPLGQEAIRTHRMYRVLADRLAAAGLAVLRFDYYGTGDSAGSDSDGEPSGWVEDSLAACELLQSRTGCTALSLFGMRLGANLALRAATRMPTPPRAVLLWDPIVDGRRYLEQLRRAHECALATAYGARWTTEPALRAFHAPAGHSEVLGFVLSVDLERGLTGIRLDEELDRAAALLPRLHVWCDPAALQGSFPTLRIHPPGIPIDWMADEALNTPIAPVEIVRGVIDALEAAR